MDRSLKDKLGLNVSSLPLYRCEPRINDLIFTVSAMIKAERLLKEGIKVEDCFDFKEVTADPGLRKYVFLSSKNFALYINIIDEKHLTRKIPTRYDVSPLAVLPKSVLFACIGDASIRRYTITKQDDQTLVLLANDGKIKESDVDNFWYVGPLSLTEEAINLLLVFLAAGNNLASEKDRYDFFESFVKAYFEIVAAQDDKVNRKREVASEYLFDTFENWVMVHGDVLPTKSGRKKYLVFTIIVMVLLVGICLLVYYQYPDWFARLGESCAKDQGHYPVEETRFNDSSSNRDL